MIIAIIALSWLLLVSLIINFTYFAHEGIDKNDVVGLLLMMFFPPYLLGWIIWQIVTAVQYRRSMKKREKENSEEEVDE